MAPKKTARDAAPKTTAITKWDEELAKHAAAAAAVTAAPTGKFIGTRGGILQYNKTPVPDNKFNVIVLHHIFENALYEGDYDPDNPASPICYAFGTDEKTMAPHPDCESPQHAQCKGCPQNEWGTADKGKGKACKNQRRLALVPEDALEGDLSESDIALLRVPVTSGQAWDAYVRNAADTLKRPPFALVTQIGAAPGEKGGFKLNFKMVSKLDGSDTFEAVLEKHNQAVKEIEAPYMKSEPAAEKPKNSKPGKFEKRAKPPIKRGR